MLRPIITRQVCFRCFGCHRPLDRRILGLAKYQKAQYTYFTSPLYVNQHRLRCTQSTESLAHITHPGQVPLAEKTIGLLLEDAAKAWPNQECIVSLEQKMRLTFADVLRRADSLAAGFKKLGLQRGDRLAIWGPNQIEWYLTLLGAVRAGLIVVAINPAYQSAELRYCLNKVGVKAIVSPRAYKTQEYFKMALDAKQSCSMLEHIILHSGDHVSGTRQFSEVESLGNRLEIETISAEQELISPYSGCNIQFTSGTTGQPKATLISHHSLYNNSRQGSARGELAGLKICTNVPFFHAFGLIMGQLASLHTGSTIVVEGPSFNPVKSLEALVAEKCGKMYGTPTMWVNLIAAQQRLNVPTDSLVAGTIGGAPASPELFKRIRERFRFQNMKSIYGLTETTGILFQSKPGEKAGLAEVTVGHLSDHVEVKVVDSNGVTVPFGVPGELWTRGYTNMMGYWNDEENTRRTKTEDGWLKTGDRFILRSDGYGQIVGRLKDMIIRGGENIFPKEIEDFLSTHPQVCEVHVIPADDDVYGEELCACVRLHDNVKMTADELRNYCRGKIAHFKIPRYIHFVEDYPKTGSGKVQKHRLKLLLEEKGLIPVKSDAV